MKHRKPIYFILMGSLALFLLTFALLFLVNSISDVHIQIEIITLFSLGVGLLGFGVFTYVIQKFINNRINIIYRLIGNKKFDVLDEYETAINKDVFNELQKKTEEWTVEQNEQIEKLEEQAKFRREFLGNLAHELKTPVFSIQGYVLTLLEGGLEDEKVNREFLERALNGVDRISAILEDLDEIAKYEFDRFSIKMSEFDIVELATKIFGELEGKAKKKKIKFEFSKDFDVVKVNADERKIAQVLTNLISNSISYGNENGTTTLRFHDLDKGKLLVEVADDGLGMDEKHLPRLFERFYRVDKSRARNVGGSGLGLAIVKHIIEAHGQSINVRSTEGTGSTFSFTVDKV